MLSSLFNGDVVQGVFYHFIHDELLALTEQRRRVDLFARCRNACLGGGNFALESAQLIGVNQDVTVREFRCVKAFAAIMWAKRVVVAWDVKVVAIVLPS